MKDKEYKGTIFTKEEHDKLWVNHEYYREHPEEAKRAFRESMKNKTDPDGYIRVVESASERMTKDK